MKKFRALIAMALALILSLGTMTCAFAANVGDEIEWPVREEYEGVNEYTNEYIYKGELKEGTNTVKNEGDYESGYCYTFEAAETGYYLFDSKNLDVEVSAKTVDGAPADIADNVYSYDYISGDEGWTYEERRLIYIQQGTAYVGADGYYYSDSEEAEIKIEYIGGELADIEFEENAFTDMVMDYDYDARSYLYMTKDINFIFADGSEYEFENARLTFVSKNTLVEGENIIETRNLFGIEKQYTMTCYPLDHYIAKVEISNLDKYLKAVEYYYPGDYTYYFYGSEADEDGIQGETLTVTLTDGTTQSFVLDWDEYITVKLMSGKEIYLFVNDYCDEGKVYFSLETGYGDVLLKEECEVTEATDAQNFKRLGERIKTTFSCMVSSLKYWGYVLENIEYYPYYSVPEVMLNMVEEIFSSLGAVGGEIRDCCGHLVLG